MFGAVIVTWFGLIATMVLYNIFHGDTSVFEALNPMLGVRFLFSGSNRVGVALMGTVFLAVHQRGASALLLRPGCLDAACARGQGLGDRSHH